MDMDSNGTLYLESRKLVKRWSGPWPALINTLIMAVFFVSGQSGPSYAA